MDLFQENSEREYPIKVALRLKPSLNNCSSWLQIIPENKEIVLKKKAKSYNFKFDEIFGFQSTQREIYQKTIGNLVTDIFLGYNATILAYGQTGSGKTYTMGTTTHCVLDEDSIGLLPRVMKEIWRNMLNNSEETKYLIKMTFLEIYNEEIIDLLKSIPLKNPKVRKENKTKITIREEKNGNRSNINIYGLSEREIHSYEEMIEVLHHGCLSRTTSSTLMNQTSSRSHAIFTIYLEQYAQNSHSNSKFKSAKFNIVDLAGSERMKKTGAVGNTLKEGININKGLLALGNVITTLAKSQKTIKKISACFRDSKLTRILQDSMGGNSRTYMIACISGDEDNFEESLSTLYYATKTRIIKNKPFINENHDLIEITKLNKELFQLKAEIINYKRFIISDKNIRTKWEMRKFEEKIYENNQENSEIFDKEENENFTTCETFGENIEENDKIKENDYQIMSNENENLKFSLNEMENDRKKYVKLMEELILAAKMKANEYSEKMLALISQVGT